MTIITHVQGFGEDGADINTAHGFKGNFDCWPERGFHPAQFGDYFFTVCTHAEDFTAAFVEVGKTLYAVGLVFNNIDQLRRRA